MSELMHESGYWIKRADRAEKYIQIQSQAIEDLRADLARRDDLIKRLVEDGERLYGKLSNLVSHDKAYEEIYELHRALMKEVEG